MRPRQIAGLVEQDLRGKMVFVAGPRQCGKTTLAEEMLRRLGGSYHNWDVEAHRRALRRSELDEAAKLWIFDELHKFKGWRNWLKGIYDLHHRSHSILVSGSARLEVYSHGGDSLQGRYFLYRLHPFTLAEAVGLRPPEDTRALPELATEPKADVAAALSDLMTLGGFPEPLFSGAERRAARWRLAYGARLVREEIRSLENLRDLDRVELLYDRLPATVGSVLSINSLREDLEVAFETVRSWIRIFDRIYATFRVAPHGAPRIKAVKKEQKLYLWDWPRVESPGPRFENLIAFHLLRLVHWMEDVEGVKAELRYFRDTLGREVDFIVLRAGKPWMAVEAKLDDRPLDPSLRYLLERVKVPYAFQVSLQGEKDWRHQDVNGARVRLLPAARFLASLP
ncbi:MAG: ATP-binding protein [Planctomycetes bacterium]|nr:ATP-binding protein [Planctomycetota bacterium]